MYIYENKQRCKMGCLQTFLNMINDVNPKRSNPMVSHETKPLPQLESPTSSKRRDVQIS